MVFTWTEDDGVRVADAGVPCIHRLADGRYRLYYHGPGGILSAISTDGLNFEKEPGVRIGPGRPGTSESMVSDPTVIALPDGRIRLYYKGADGPGGPGKAVHKIFSAVSSDGLDFEKEGLRIDPKMTGDGGWASVPGAVKLPDGSVRIYYVSGAPEADGGIMSAISEDGLSFQREEGVRVKAFVDPSVIILPDGKYMLLAAVLPPPPDVIDKTEYPLGIYGFFSDNGLDFGEPQAVLQGRCIDPAVIKLSANSYRIFYGSEDEQGKPVIKSATGQETASDSLPAANGEKGEEAMPDESLQEPSLSSHFGFVGNIAAVGNDESNYFRPFDELGIKWDRPHAGPFRWNLIEANKGTYDFSQTDLYVKQAQEHSLQVLATIWPFVEWDQEYWESQPGWQESRGFERELPSSRYKPHDMSAYKEFVQAMVERYDGDAQNDMPGLQYPIKYWEVLNEPETGLMGSDFSFFKGDAQDYLEVLRATSEAIRSADEDAIILNGGGTGGPGSLEFWQEVLASGGWKYFDIGNTHSICPPGDSVDQERNTEIWADLLAQCGLGDLWVTEVQIGSGKIAGQNISEEEQARQLVKEYVQGFADGADKIFYTFYIAMEPPPGQEVLDFALIDSQGNKKPAYHAMKTIIQKLDGFLEAQVMAEGQYKFMLDNKTIYVLWGPGNIPAEITGEVTVTDISGSEQRKLISDINLSDSPVFVELE